MLYNFYQILNNLNKKYFLCKNIDLEVKYKIWEKN